METKTLSRNARALTNSANTPSSLNFNLEPRLSNTSPDSPAIELGADERRPRERDFHSSSFQPSTSSLHSSLNFDSFVKLQTSMSQVRTSCSVSSFKFHFIHLSTLLFQQRRWPAPAACRRVLGELKPKHGLTTPVSSSRSKTRPLPICRYLAVPCSFFRF